VLVTGPTGSGKSTTLATLIDQINRTRNEHILTIEDPIEFLHWHRSCIVNQREMGPDAPSFADALRAALRQDPDVDPRRRDARPRDDLDGADRGRTGHLVFATLHTQSAPQTIDRIIDVFPAEQQDQVRVQLAGTLQGSSRRRSSRLPTGGPDRGARDPAPGRRRPQPDPSGKVEQIYSVIQTGTARGMQTMEQALADLVLRKVITRDIAIGRSSRPEQLDSLLERGVSLSNNRQAHHNGLRLAGV
jgi:twitching motility protein PilT